MFPGGAILISFKNFLFASTSWLIIKHWRTSFQPLMAFDTCFSLILVQFSCSVVSTLSYPMDCNMPGLHTHHQLLELTQTHIHWVGDAIQISHPLLSPFSCLQSSPASGCQSIGASASASVLPMNIQDWFPLGLAGLVSLQSKGLSRAFSNTTVQKHQFFGTQLSL